MYRLFSTTVFRAVPVPSNRVRVVPHLQNGRDRVVALFQFLQCFASESSLVVKVDGRQEEVAEDHSFTVSYLVNSCGFSVENATSVSKKVRIETRKKPDSVLCLLKEHGFTNTQISKLIKARPRLLLANGEKNILPKLRFFLSLEASRAEITNFISSKPVVLSHSLEKRLIPTYNFLKNAVCLNDNKIVSCMKRLSWVAYHQVLEHLVPNISVLRGHGVSQSTISLFITCNPIVLTQNTEKFGESVQRVINMGFNPSTANFVKAMAVLSELRSSTWGHKVEFYRRWGWSEDEIWSAFKKQPLYLTLSEKKIMSAMNFLVNTMDMTPSTIAESPGILIYSLNKRIVPRGSVIKVLQLKGLIKKNRALSTVLVLTEKRFMEKFVTKYLDDVPQLLEIFCGKICLEEFGFGNEQLSR